MPSVSEAQRRTMRAAAHNSEFAKKVGIPQGVAREYESADKAKASRGGFKGAAEHAKKRSGSRAGKGSGVGGATGGGAAGG